MRSETDAGIVSATNPHTIPNRNEAGVPLVIRKDNPVPTVVNRTELRTIVFVEGNATRLIML